MVRTIQKPNKMAAILFVPFWNSWDYKPNIFDHPKSEHVRYSSPHCISNTREVYGLSTQILIGHQKFDWSAYHRSKLVIIHIPTLINLCRNHGSSASAPHGSVGLTSGDEKRLKKKKKSDERKKQSDERKSMNAFLDSR